MSMTLPRGETAKMQKMNNFAVSFHWNYTLEAQQNCFYLTGTKASPNRGRRHLFRLSKTLLVRVSRRLLTQIVCSEAQKNHLVIRNDGSQFAMRGGPSCSLQASCLKKENKLEQEYK